MRDWKRRERHLRAALAPRRRTDIRPGTLARFLIHAEWAGPPGTSAVSFSRADMSIAAIDGTNVEHMPELRWA